MRSLAYASATLTVPLSGTAPESIGGKVYRDMTAIAGLRAVHESTIVFREDGRFVVLKSAAVNFVSHAFASGRVLLSDPGRDGSYIYRRTGDATGAAELRYDDGRSGELEWIFTSPSGGYSGPSERSPDRTFVLEEADAPAAMPASNISTRSRVAPGFPLHVGFVVPGLPRPDSGRKINQAGAANAREVLIRAVGPSLAPLGVGKAWADPDFALFRGGVAYQPGQYRYADWSTVPAAKTGIPGPNPGGVAAFRKIFGYVGAFPLLEGSKDAAAVVRLPPGAYTIVAEPRTGDPGGEVVIEVYFLP